MKILEKDVLRACRDYLTAKGIFHWRSNNMGTYRGDGKYSFSGLAGVSDLIAVLPQKVTVDGREEIFGNILCIEVKSPTGVVSEPQRQFAENINSRGGISIIVRSVDELKEELDRFL